MIETIKNLYYLIYPGLFLKTSVRFYSLFLELYRTGIPITRCFSLMAQRIRDRRLRATLHRMEGALSAGEDFVSVLEKERKVFGDWEINMLTAGETSGKLEAFLTLLKGHYERLLNYQRMATGAATGPLLTLVIFIFFFSLVDLIKSGFMGYLMATVVPLILTLVVSAVLWALVKHAAAIAPVNSLFMRIKVSLPLWGAIQQKIITARFAQTLALLLEAGMDAPESITLAAQSTTVPAVMKGASKLLDQQNIGAGWGSNLNLIPFLNKDFIEGISLAEETGRLDRVALDIARDMNKYVESKLQTLLPILMKLVTIPLLLLYFFLKLYLIALAFIAWFLERLSDILAERGLR
ncbi:type II secretion system F family protein [candidate division CSSED10-310 bacterium]|uniref:Type II secretion system F family protein n=1 Tax=candidate division CSSED10-310 bacterium TaxID=2855610 RepID=A0ABV6YTS5_UNCC1